MKTLRIIGRNIRDAFKGVFRNFSLSFASISCITITLIVVTISIILSDNVDNFTNLVERDVTIVAFIDNEADDSKIEEIREEISSLNNIEEYEFRSKEEITNEMRDSSDVFDSIMGNWTDDENPIQNTFQVKVTDINKIDNVAKKIEKIDGITLVKYGEGIVEQLISTFEFIHKICIGAVIALILVTAFLISNTIKITISSRQREIGIMRLIGASNLNIRIPFIIEGLLLGLLGSIIPVALTIYGYNSLYHHFNGQLFSPFIKLIEPVPFVYYTSLILVGIGILVGMFGSWRAVRKHLKI
ncbi:MAG TPA: ABC transporter permease [Candidatus Coprosoma intestinipullorum]|uniref:Cell division protein FtsX n=1 Tax=Candidatus Coprosoma intestinipullorum TaxID=2840752 RepID=A0A9D1CY89_9FIRM|nr:ABC transporter permease [Candidatus Coprosoma intestinipullorum]